MSKYFREAIVCNLNGWHALLCDYFSIAVLSLTLQIVPPCLQCESNALGSSTIAKVRAAPTDTTFELKTERDLYCHE